MRTISPGNARPLTAVVPCHESGPGVVVGGGGGGQRLAADKHVRVEVLRDADDWRHEHCRDWTREDPALTRHSGGMDTAAGRRASTSADGCLRQPARSSVIAA